MKEQIEVECVADLDQALDYVKNRRVPFVIRNYNIGECTTKWSVDYLKEKINREVKIHVAPSGDMNFIKKNFVYRTLPFGEFMKRASEETHTEYFIDPNEKYYLRSIGDDERKDISDIRKQFPQINDDIIFPPLFDSSRYFSSVFRITSRDVRIWTHYDAS